MTHLGLNLVKKQQPPVGWSIMFIYSIYPLRSWFRQHQRWYAHLKTYLGALKAFGMFLTTEGLKHYNIFYFLYNNFRDDFYEAQD